MQALESVSACNRTRSLLHSFFYCLCFKFACKVQRSNDDRDIATYFMVRFSH